MRSSWKKILLYGIGILVVLAIVGVLVDSLSREGRVRSTPKSFSGARYAEEASLGIAQAPSAVVDSVREAKSFQRKIIKNGSLSLLVKKAEEAAVEIQSIAERFSGFVQASNIYEVGEGVKSGTITIRVPTENFGLAMTEIKKLAVKVERESVNAEDVTEQFVDLEARLKNLRAEENQYLEIMKSAKTVEDTLKVAERLGIVRGQIESIEGQLKYLSRQVDMSTITVSLTAEAEVEVFGIQWRPLFVVKQAFRNMLNGLTRYVDTMVRIILFLPVLIFWIITVVVALAILWRIFRFVRRKFFTSV